MALPLLKPISLPTFETARPFGTDAFAEKAAMFTGSGEFTPDMVQLEKKCAQLLFVYDGWKKNFSGHNVLETMANKECKAFTRDYFTVWKKRLPESDHTAYPIPLQAGFREAPARRIKGELYAVFPAWFKMLDTLKANGLHFKRERVHLVIPYRRKRGSLVSHVERTYIIRAWIYIGIRDYWLPKLDAGFEYKPVKRFTSNNQHNIALNEYYEWTSMDENQW